MPQRKKRFRLGIVRKSPRKGTLLFCVAKQTNVERSELWKAR